MSNKKAVYRILIGTDTDPSSTTGPSNIPTGAVVIFNKDFGVLAPGETVSDYDTIYIAQGTASGPIISLPIRGESVVSYLGESYVAPVAQVEAVGYNGTDGSIEVSNDTEYFLSIENKQVKDIQNSVRRYSYVSDSSATQTEIARNFVKQINLDTSGREEAVILTNGTFTALGGASTLAVVNGSRIATASAGGHALVAGDLVRIGGTGASVPVYFVESVSGTAITLETPYQGATATVANANVGEMSVVTLVGIRLESKADDTLEEYPVFFEVGVDLGFDSTPVRTVTAVNFGSGTDAQVGALESYAQGYLGHMNRVFIPNSPTAYTVTGATYDIYAIEHLNTIDSSFNDSVQSPLTATLVALPVGSQAANYAAFESALNTWMASTPKAFAAVSL